MIIKQAREVLKIEADSILDLTEKIDQNFVDMIDQSIAYCEADSEVKRVVEGSTNSIRKTPYF